MYICGLCPGRQKRFTLIRIRIRVAWSGLISNVSTYSVSCCWCPCDHVCSLASIMACFYSKHFNYFFGTVYCIICGRRKSINKFESFVYLGDEKEKHVWKLNNRNSGEKFFFPINTYIIQLILTNLVTWNLPYHKIVNKDMSI